jgi:UDP-N-acetylglucosamine 4,6-dehydratase
MPLHTLTRNKKYALMVFTDTLLVLFSLWVAYSLRLSTWFWPTQSQSKFFLLAIIIALPTFYKFGLYREIVRYIGHRGMLAIVRATGAVVLLWFIATTTLLLLFYDVEIRFPLYLGAEMAFPRSIPVIFWMTLLLSVGGSRQFIRWLFIQTTTNHENSPKKNVLIYGAGQVGVELSSSLSHNKDIKVLGFIDDDPTLIGYFAQDLKILGDRSEIEKISSKISPLEVLLAAPKMEKGHRKEILNYLQNKKVAVRSVPPFEKIISGAAKMSDIHDIDITDLLGREEVAPNQRLLTACISNKNILVTGAGGSIGSELCHQILSLNPTNLILFEHSEHNLYSINLQLSELARNINSKVKIIPILGSITNKILVEKTVDNFKIDTIYHAAAYKHVTLLENNIREGALNNIFGTFIVAKAALDLGVKSFILISTDKAVRPTSVMGATKRIAELIIQGLSNKNNMGSTNIRSTTRFAIVRFGNVLGSSGSVIPLFKKQISEGGPITITHPEATRYFMTIPEASQLVIQAGSIGDSSNVFVLNMGDPISILSLAKQMVYLSGRMIKSGKTKEKELYVEIQYTGLQKGEKIHEELFIGDNITNTEHPMIMNAQEEFCEWSNVENMLSEIESHLYLNPDKLRQILIQFGTNSSF